MKMIKFRDYLKEMVTAGMIGKYLVQAGINSKGLENPLTRQTLNAQLSKTTGHSFITPYIAIGAISRVLAYANIILPQYIFLNKENGEVVFDVNQFGRMDGIELDGTKVFNTFKEPYYVYFTYDLNEEGYFDVFAAIVNADELARLMNVGDEMDDIEEEITEEPINELSKKTLGSYVKKASDDVSYHSFTAGGAAGKEKAKSLQHDKKAFSRQQGIEKAVDRMTKEELDEEPINELGSETLRRYMNKARSQMYGKLGQNIEKGEPGAEKAYDKRASGVERAGEKFKKAYRDEYKKGKVQ